MIIKDIINQALTNNNFRKVIYTGKNSQVVVMSIPAGEDIGREKHVTIDQILVNVQGSASAAIEDETTPVEENDVVYVNKDSWHNIINIGSVDLKLYTIYSPPQHPDGTIHATKADAVKAEKAEDDAE